MDLPRTLVAGANRLIVRGQYLMFAVDNTGVVYRLQFSSESDLALTINRKIREVRIPQVMRGANEPKQVWRGGACAVDKEKP